MHETARRLGWTFVVLAATGLMLGGGCRKKDGGDEEPASGSAGGGWGRSAEADVAAGERTASGGEARPDAAAGAAAPGDAAESADGVRAPSTGREVPRETAELSNEQAVALIRRALAEMEKPEPNCAAVVDALIRALPAAAPQVNPQTAPAYRAMQTCAVKSGRWRAAVLAGMALLKAGAPDVRVSAVVRALANLGEYEKAIGLAREALERLPDQRTDITAGVVFALFNLGEYAAGGRAAEEELQRLRGAGGPLDGEAALTLRLFRAFAVGIVKNPEAALVEVSAIEDAVGREEHPLPPSLRRFVQQLERAKGWGMFVEATPTTEVALGIYHLMGRPDTGALVTLRLFEHEGRDRELRVEAEIPGVTERASNAVRLPANGGLLRAVHPPLKIDFDVAAIRAERPAQLSLRVSETTDAGERVLIDETIPVKVLPRDYLPLRRLIGADAAVPTPAYLAAWVTPNDRAVETFLTAAKERAPGRAFVGRQAATRPQVKALFEELKARGVSYVFDPSVSSETVFVQRTRLPAEVLASTNAQCLEGSLLFATLLEAIGLRPILILVPGHAFVGWHTVPADGTNGEPLFLETTLISAAGFDDAVGFAGRRAAQELGSGAFERGVSYRVDVDQLRRAGFTPQPL
jgi:tetratricopeptide (TPR) repeat protein